MEHSRRFQQLGRRTTNDRREWSARMLWWKIEIENPTAPNFSSPFRSHCCWLNWTFQHFRHLYSSHGRRRRLRLTSISSLRLRPVYSIFRIHFSISALISKRPAEIKLFRVFYYVAHRIAKRTRSENKTGALELLPHFFLLHPHWTRSRCLALQTERKICSNECEEAHTHKQTYVRWASAPSLLCAGNFSGGFIFSVHAMWMSPLFVYSLYQRHRYLASAHGGQQKSKKSRCRLRLAWIN